MSERVMEIIPLLSEGLSFREIGERQCISPRTIENHKIPILDKLDLKNTLCFHFGDFGDLEFTSAIGNRNEIPKGLKVNSAYLEGYLSARYNEQIDYDPDSSANQWREIMGLNKQGTITSSATMFANKYPWEDALKLFGNLSGYGAQ